MLETLLVVSALFNVVATVPASVGLSELGQSGRPALSWLGALLLLGAIATLAAAGGFAGADPVAVVAVGSLPPMALLIVLALEPDALWGNFPPAQALRALYRVTVVGVLAAPPAIALALS